MRKGEFPDFSQEEEILKRYGIKIDIKETLEKIAEEKSWRFDITRGAALINLRNIPTEDVLTSELIQMWATPGVDRKYGAELEYRFSLLGLTDDQKKAFLASDLKALSKKDPHIAGQALSTNRWDFSSINNLPKVDSCTASELVSVIDAANAAWTYDHEWVSDDSIGAIGLAMSANGQFHKDLMKRFNLMGLVERQWRSFIKNECLITSRAKWGYKPSEKSWTPDSMVK
jgi:hypothetical protein